MQNRLPSNFRWGVATSSFQIEGATGVDGRSASIWDTFCDTPGKVKNGDNGHVACDHYNRYADDVALMRELGVQDYRFSLAWPRLIPNGVGAINKAGFDFYDRLVDELLANDIRPVATLYHWDLPQVLEDQGGWSERSTAYALAELGAAAVERLGDRVKDWATLNEPWCVSWLGYMSGVHAPGVKDLDRAIAAAHHTALAHGLTARRMREVRSDLRVGLVCNMTNYRVEDTSDHDLNELAGLMDSHVNRWWIDAFLTGAYPQNLVDSYGERLARVMQPGDEDIIKVDTDFLGINYYSDSFINVPDENDKPMIDGGLFPFPQRAGGKVPEPTTAMGWAITPEGLGNLLKRINRDWPAISDLVICENGAAFDDEVAADGTVQDVRRRDYIVSHIDSMAAAVAAGVPVTAYYAWSFLDNFEWAEGYDRRFGIVHVDFETQKRTPKLSALDYAAIIASHSRVSEAVAR